MAKHTIAVIGSKFYLFGGITKENKEDSDRIFIFDAGNFLLLYIA